MVVEFLVVSVWAILALFFTVSELTSPASSTINYFVFWKLYRGMMQIVTNLRFAPRIFLISFPIFTLGKFHQNLILGAGEFLLARFSTDGTRRRKVIFGTSLASITTFCAFIKVLISRTFQAASFFKVRDTLFANLALSYHCLYSPYFNELYLS